MAYKWNTAHIYDQSTDYTKYGPPVQLVRKEPVAPIAAKYNIFPQMAQIMNLVGADGNRSRGLTSGRRDSYPQRRGCLTRMCDLVTPCHQRWLDTKALPVHVRMCIGRVDTRSNREGHAPSPDMFERGGSVMGVCIRIGIYVFKFINYRKVRAIAVW